MNTSDIVRDLAKVWMVTIPEIVTRAAKNLRKEGDSVTAVAFAGNVLPPASPEVFISHAGVEEDRETADMLRCFLAGEGLCCTMSTCGAPAAAGVSGVLVLVFSNHANASASVREEVALAATANIPIILFCTDDVPATGGLETALEGAFRICADRDHPLFSVFDVVRQAAKVLGRDLPGVKARYWAKGAPETYAYLRITTDPPGGHIRVIWPIPEVEGPSPFYLKATMSWVEIEATMEGYEPHKFRIDIDDDSSSTDCYIGLRALAAAQEAREREAAAKLNDGGNSVEEVSEELAEQRRQWDLLDVAWRRALDQASCDVSIGARPGQPREVGSITVIPRSDECWVMNADRYDPLMRLYEDRVLSGRPAGFLAGIAAMLRNRRACDPHFLPGILADAIGVLRSGLLGKGSGPVAPCFDEFDEAAEACRGKWYVFDGAAYSAFGELIRSLSSNDRKSGRA